MDNKRFVSEYLAALSGNPKSTDLIERYVTDPALVEHITQVEAAFPGYELIAHQMVAENDLVVVRGTFRGKHSGAPFAGIEPSGKDASGDLMIIYRIENGRIAQHWLQFDFPALLAQLQPAPAAAVVA
jgi:predicted ester cyclase